MDESSRKQTEKKEKKSFQDYILDDSIDTTLKKIITFYKQRTE
jgi:hypothetical protein